MLRPGSRVHSLPAGAATQQKSQEAQDEDTGDPFLFAGEELGVRGWDNEERGMTNEELSIVGQLLNSPELVLHASFLSPLTPRGGR
jgi:hypothetical protein